MIKKTARKYTPREACIVTCEMFSTIRYFMKGKKKNQLDSAFVERLMLAVTQVNGCAICSYKHTAEALKAGLSEKEIQEILSGSMENIPRKECVAVLFAQHYAENKGCPKKESWLRLVQTYGEKRALFILGAIRTIMFGNVFGIPLSSLYNRIRKRKGASFSLFYELGMTMLAVPFLAVGSLHALFGLFKKSDLIRFSA